jgi:hypothetical protein
MVQDATSNGDPRCIVRADRCAVHGVTGDTSSAKAEVAVLRRQVAELEAALTAARAQVANGHSANRTTTNGSAANGSAVNGSAPKPPAPAPVVTQLPRVPVPDPAPSVPVAVAAQAAPVPLVEPESPSDFSHAWADGDATLEERIAARAIFRDEVVEEPSRRWFLNKN